MATKKEVLEAAARGEGCLGKSQDDEPVFVLTARDIYAPGTIRHWAMQLGPGSSNDKSHPDYGKPINPKFRDAMEIANTMADWQAKHGSKTPD